MNGNGFTTRTALLADIHGNSPALEAVLTDIRRCGCRSLVFLGDLINGVDPGGCVRLLREIGREFELFCVKGNAEAYLLTPDLDHLPGPPEPWTGELIQLIAWFRARLTTADLEWIGAFDDYLHWQETILVHDSPLDRLEPQRWHRTGIAAQYQEWLYHSPGIQVDMAEGRWQDLFDCMNRWRLNQVFCAHTHAAFIHRNGAHLVCNVGSVGAPLDGEPRAAWVMVDESGSVAIQRVEYDVAQTHRLIDQTDYPDFQRPGYRAAYKKWFSTGVHWRVHLRDIGGD